MRLLIAINNNKGKKSELSKHFGRCKYFAIYETKTETLEIVENKLDHANTQLTPVDQTMIYSPDTIVALGIGSKAIKLFKEKNVNLKTGKYKTVGEVIENIDNLENLNQECS